MRQHRGESGPADSSTAITSTNENPRPRRVLLAMDHYMHETHKGAADFARSAGWLLDLRPSHLPNLPPSWKGEGILTFAGQSDFFGPAARATGLPIVNMSPWGAKFGLPSVQLDNFKIGEMAAEHLIERGLQELGMIQFMPASLTGGTRRRGFVARVEKSGRRFHPLVLPSHIEYAGALAPHMLEWLPAVLAQLPKPLGLLAEGDIVAVELIRMFQELGLKVPDDIAVVGIDNDPLVVETSPVPVTSVDSNLYGLGMQAAALLDRILNGEPAPENPILVPPRGVVQRRSSEIMAFASEEVAVAIAFIRSRFRDPITVGDVARAALVSRRRLQDLFMDHVGRSILQEIVRCRLDLAKQMLLESPLKISLIGQQCGLGSAPQMSKVFLREMHITPTEYRQQHAHHFRADEL